MTRVQQALIEGGKSYNPEGTASIVNLANTGNNGLYKDLAYLANNTPYQQQQSIVVLLRPPRLFEKHPLGEQLTAALKVFVEVWPNSVEGLNLQLQVDQNSVEQGWDRQPLRTPGGVYRPETTISFSGTELYNKAWSKFWNYYVRTFIGDPNHVSPNLAELDSLPDDHLIDQYTFDILMFEPDPLKRTVVSAAAVVGMWPASLPEDSLRKNIAEGTPTKDISVECPGTVDDSRGFYKIAQDILDEMAIYSLNSNRRASFTTEIDADSRAAAGGILNQAENMSKTWTE